VVTANPTDSSETTIVDQAHITGAITDSNSSNNTTTENTTVRPSSDLSATILANPNPALAAQVLTYTVQVTNAGPSASSSVDLTVTLPDEVTFISASPSMYNCTGSPVVSCSIPNMDPGISNNVYIQVSVPSDIGVPLGMEVKLVSSAVVGGLNHDPVLENNSTSLETPFDPQADLSVTLTDPFDPISAGNDVIYEIAVTNNGPSTAKQVVIKNTFPDKVTLPSDPTGCSSSGSILTCPVGNLTPSSTFTMTIIASVDKTVSGNIENKVEVSATTNDPVPTNNITSTITTVNPPTIAIQWTSPVASSSSGAIYSTKSPKITLSVDVSSLLGILQVAFWRSDPAKGFMLIGVDYTAPYSITINTSDLNYGWNQVFADAYDKSTSGNRSNLWLWVVTPHKVYLPEVFH
jgi:uncharacterized repeat protein (TIGR01451 family)